MNRTWWTRTVAALVVGGAGLAGAASVVPAQAAAPAGPAARGTTDASTAGPTSVSVFLRAPHAAALAQLASQPVGDRARRLRELAALVPSQATHDRVAGLLRDAGLTVTSESTWSLTATASAEVVGRVFGVRPALPRDPSLAETRAATGALPVLPGELAGLVSAVFPTTGGPAAFHRATSTLQGRDVRNADTPARVKPSTGTKDAKLTIATLQLATFNSGDLTAYAKKHHIADPVAAKRFQAIDVDGGPGAGDMFGGGDIEVALDQESLLSTAPSAAQHAYFAPNTDAGFDDVFAAVYDDATGNRHATAPDKHLAAMSVSWGGCEAVTGARSIKALEPILQSVVAAGVTIFASAGDDGIYDCGSADGTGGDNSVADVDYPASSPEVVSVGGTRLRAASSRANTGRNWTETVWSCTSPSSCQNSTTGTGGGGGGVSGNAYRRSTGGTRGNFRGFAKPLYQQRAVTSGPYAKVKTRMAPDIAADGDPQSGFEVYTSDPMYVVLFGGNTGVVGGTSLAAPLSAAQLTNTLGDAHRTTGVGDIHGALYSAYADTKALKATSRRKAFRDVVRGTIGANADRGRNPSVTATRGYDTASGLGGVLWSALKPYLVERKAPRLTASLRSAGHGRAVARWSTSRGRDRILVGRTRVVVLAQGRKKPVASYSGLHGRRTVHVRPGTRLVLYVITTDIAGHFHHTTRTLRAHR